ncbi:accessory Sec system protein Asp1 [Staphylococcus delphini]|uniref:accessory Sec system protein Asp1 n=1 Tax=Staphylococcus delphini TaxID=53344 RepID=UPI0021D33A46|nr:accessory Sec system protein Asp1 [Staphylococcus delphini]UXS21900.1 accessory Sec system protein Asp1 [Staphylococcus delphini]UXS57840.1 accessory Sec system protein Asp1 [Staphylococcus delphini]
MKRFIPAWYRSDDWWSNQVVPFYMRGAVVNEFDDLISLMGMHLKNEAPFEIVLLNYVPDLRTFLHRHELFEAPYWSLFDHIQGFAHRTPQSVDYRQLNWPKETEFVHSPLMIRAITSDNTHSDIHFSQEGYLLWIEAYKNNKSHEQYIFDDRGFLSSYTVADDEGYWATKYFLTADGDWIMKENLFTNEVTIHPKYAHRFDKTRYEDMRYVILEHFDKYAQENIQPHDVMIVASDVRHNSIIAESVPEERLCYSVFQMRDSWLSEDGKWSMTSGKYWLADTLENANRLAEFQQQNDLDNQLMRITPFDVQITPNLSSQLHETFIGVWADGLDKETLHEITTQLIHEIEREPLTRVVLLTRLENGQMPIWMHDEVYRIQRHFDNLSDKPELDQDIAKYSSNEPISYASLKSVPFENDIVEAISTLRLVIDLNEEPDLFLQICCMGAGLPQINRIETDYIQHERNGYVISSVASLPTAMDFYLTQLKNWNRSYAYAMRLAKMYGSNEILKQLDDWLEGETHGTKI